MFESAGAAVKAGSKIQGKGKTTTSGTPGQNNSDFFSTDSDNNGIKDYLQG
jgi:hypothetical protein